VCRDDAARRGLDADHELAVDVAVIGTGAGGAVAAAELAAAGARVVVLERAPIGAAPTSTRARSR
jgi:choline dehydrogenase-like flavoprotein